MPRCLECGDNTMGNDKCVDCKMKEQETDGINYTLGGSKGDESE
jgi:hypothetical protein